MTSAHTLIHSRVQCTQSNTIEANIGSLCEPPVVTQLRLGSSHGLRTRAHTHTHGLHCVLCVRACACAAIREAPNLPLTREPISSAAATLIGCPKSRALQATRPTLQRHIQCSSLAQLGGRVCASARAWAQSKASASIAQHCNRIESNMRKRETKHIKLLLRLDRHTDRQSASQTQRQRCVTCMHKEQL